MKTKHIILGAVLPIFLAMSSVNADTVNGSFTIKDGNLYIKNELPSLNFNDSFDSDTDWTFMTSDVGFTLNDYSTGLNVFSIESSYNNIDTFKVDSSGDINLANGSVFIDRDKNYIGIGTPAPETDLHIKNTVEYNPTGWISQAQASIKLETAHSFKWSLISSYQLPLYGRYKERRFHIKDDTADTYPFTIAGGAPTDSLYVNDKGNMGIGTNSPTTKIHAVSKFNNPSQIVTELVALEVRNTDATGFSDTGFKLVNSKESVAWTFRTLEEDSNAKGNTNSFAISKKNSGAKELILTGKDAEHGNMLILANGAYCDGVWHNTSSRSMKKDIKPLSTKAALETFSKLQPVTYVYKSNPTDQKVGFIAEDVPELVADPKHKSLSSMDMVAVLTKVVQEQDRINNEQSRILTETQSELKAAQEKISEFEAMQKKVAMLESILTNLALDTSSTKKEKISLK